MLLPCLITKIHRDFFLSFIWREQVLVDVPYENDEQFNEEYKDYKWRTVFTNTFASIYLSARFEVYKDNSLLYRSIPSKIKESESFSVKHLLLKAHAHKWIDENC